MSAMAVSLIRQAAAMSAMGAGRGAAREHMSAMLVVLGHPCAGMIAMCSWRSDKGAALGNEGAAVSDKGGRMSDKGAGESDEGSGGSNEDASRSATGLTGLQARAGFAVTGACNHGAAPRGSDFASFGSATSRLRHHHDRPRPRPRPR